MLWLLGANDRDADLAAGKRKAEEGFVAFKVKVGIATVEDDLARCAAIREALGPGVRLSADANQGFTRAQALVFAAGAAGAGLDFVEQPVDGHDLDGMALVAAATTVPIGADEGVHGLADVERHHAMRAARGASLKTIKFGGLSGVLAAGRRMDALGMSVNLASKMADLSPRARQSCISAPRCRRSTGMRAQPVSTCATISSRSACASNAVTPGRPSGPAWAW